MHSVLIAAGAGVAGAVAAVTFSSLTSSSAPAPARHDDVVSHRTVATHPVPRHVYHAPPGARFSDEIGYDGR